MGHTLTSLLTHVIFSTKERFPMLTKEIRPEIISFAVGIAGNVGSHVHAIGGVDDHLHVLIETPAKFSMAEIVGKIKSNSSRIVNEKKLVLPRFDWQEGYGAFSVGRSQVEDVAAYIERQEEHHRRVTFQEEFVTFLQRYGVRYDERYIWR